MAGVNLGDIVRVVALMKLDGLHDVVNVYHFEQRVAGQASGDVWMTDVAAYLDSAYTEIVAHISNRLEFFLITGQNLTQDEILPEKTWPLLVTGSDAGDMLPEQLCPYVFWRTPRPRTRSSVFLPPFGEGAWTGANIPPAALTSLQNYANRFTGDFVMTLGAIRKGAFNPGLLRFSECSTGIRQTSYRTQRRRRIGVGS